jgi:hypothetical protein
MSHAVWAAQLYPPSRQKAMENRLLLKPSQSKLRQELAVLKVAVLKRQ